MKTREIKFRVWDKVDERMKQAEMEWFDDMFAFRFDHRGFEEEDNSDVVIMQYTGLKDKNGKDIYENDILLWDTDTVVKVEFHKGEYRGCQITGPVPGNLHCHHFGKSEIIGNIFQNPELL